MSNDIVNPASSEAQDRMKAMVAAALAIWSAFMLWLCWRSGVRHDYFSYVGQWQLLVDGLNPWSTDNTYGVVHTLFGYLLPFGTLAPKFAIVAALLTANAALAFELVRKRGLSPINIVYLAAVPANVLAVSVGIVYALNDALVAAFLVAAVLCRVRGNFVAVGLLVPFAALTKYYPLLLLPFFALDGRRLRWTVITSGTAFFLVGLLATVAIWGHAPIDAVLYSSSREPKLLSILAAAKSAFGDQEILDWLVKLNSLLVVVGVGAAFGFFWWTGVHWLVGAVLGYMLMLTIYKVGHPQFFLAWLFMVACLPLVGARSTDRIAVILMPVVLLLSIYDLGYVASDHYVAVLGSVRAYGGFVAFPISFASMAACLMNLRINSA